MSMQNVTALPSSWRRLAGLLMVVLGLTGCASVPPEAVSLSRHVGTQIGHAQTAHLSTLDAFYKRLRDDNDKWIADTYLPRLSSLAIDKLDAACLKLGNRSKECSQLDNEDLKRILAQTIRYRDDLQRVLASNRDEVARVIQAHYADLHQANATVTAALASVVDLKKASRDAAAQIGNSLGLRIDTDKIEQALSSFLQQAGPAGAKLTDLEKSLSEIAKPAAPR